MDHNSTPTRWHRLVRRLRADRGSQTVQELGWTLFWLTVLTGAGVLIWTWVDGKVQQIVGF